MTVKIEGKIVDFEVLSEEKKQQEKKENSGRKTFR